MFTPVIIPLGKRAKCVPRTSIFIFHWHFTSHPRLPLRSQIAILMSAKEGMRG